MTHAPRTVDEIYKDLKAGLTDRIVKLTNFTERSFNYVLATAFAEQIQRIEALALASEFSGWIDYVGGPITESDLEDLGLEDSIEADQINDLMEDHYLDEYVKIVGITRFEGQEATGTVTFTTQSAATTIPEGTVVTTIPESDGSTLNFETTALAETADGETTVSGVPIRAVEVGEEHNVPADTIRRFASPPIGVKGVTNPESTTGGEERESNDELRERAKQQVEGASEGGTVEGIKAFLRQNVDAIGEGDVIIEEFTDPCPPYVDVIVDGGDEQEVLDAIDTSRPTGIRHDLIRPQIFQIGANTYVDGTDVAEDPIEDEIIEYLLNSGISDDLYKDDLIRLIMERDDDILNIDYLNLTYDRVTNSRYVFDQDVAAAIAQDGTTFTDQTTDANDDDQDDMTLLPSAPAVGDAYYFADMHRFAGIDIDISTPGAGTWNIVWEYWNGSNWVLLSNVTDNTNDFRNAGRNTVSWDVPSDWVRATIDDTQNYFVRARLDTFTDMTQQPLGEQVFLEGLSQPLDLTYENTNGSITVEDETGSLYTEGTDFVVSDYSNDGWPETLQWLPSGGSPVNGDDYFIDYDVSTDATQRQDLYPTTLVRDEEKVFQNGVEETFSFDSVVDRYKLDFIPFAGTTTITDESGDTYTEGTDYQVISVGLDEREEDFTYSNTKDTYYLLTGVDETTVTLVDEGGVNYVRGTDFTVIDSDADGIEDAIQWDTNQNTPTDGTEFFVTYEADNGLPQTIDWSLAGAEPNDNEQFTVTYDKQVYHLKYETSETPEGEITDATGDIYEEDTVYDFVDVNADNENDALRFFNDPATLHDGESFYISYITEGDVAIGTREKVDPSTGRIRVDAK